jgi:hypothetical protein
MDGSVDAASLGVVYAVSWGVTRIADHDATKRFFAEFPTQLVGHGGENGAPEDAELGYVRHRGRKESEGNATGETDRAVVSAVAEVHNGVDSARPHGIGNGHVVEHRRGIVPDSAPGAFGFAEQVMSIGGRELHTYAQASTHLSGDNSINYIVRVELEDRCERA